MVVVMFWVKVVTQYNGLFSMPQQFDRIILGTIKPFIFLHTHKTNVCYFYLSIFLQTVLQSKCKNIFPQKLLDMHGLIPNYVFRYEEIQDNFQAICGS